MTHAHCNSELIKNKLKEKAKHINTWQTDIQHAQGNILHHTGIV